MLRSRLAQQRIQSQLLTCVANSSVVDLDAHFVSLRRCDFNVLETQVFAGLPCHSGFASNCLNDENRSAPLVFGPAHYLFVFLVTFVPEHSYLSSC